MRLSRLEVLLGLVLVVVVTACGEVATSPSPTATLELIQPHIAATLEPPSTPVPEVIPGGAETVTLAPEGQVLVAGEVDSATGMAYLLDSVGWLYVFDGASLEVVAQQQVLSSVKEGYAYDLAIDTEGGKVFVADGAREEILILDAETLSPLGRVDGSGRIAVDPVTQRLYVAQVGVYVADGEKGEIIDRIDETIPEEGMELFSGVPRGVDVYVNPDNRHLYVMTDNNTPGSNSRWWLDLYDADDYTLLAEYVPSFNWFSYAPGFDFERGLDYVSGGHPISAERKLVALNREGQEAAHLWGVRGDVFFSPRRDLIYIAGWEELDVIDAQTMNYLDAYPLKIVLHDPRNGRFYYADWGSEASITIFDEPIVSLAPRSATSEWRGRLPIDEYSGVDGLAFSPAFSSDETLFATVGTSLLISTDAGDSWMETILPFAVRGTTVGVRLSPGYERDGMILVGLDCTPVGGGVLRSTDEGLHWTRANTGLTDLGIADLVFSPEYAQDETVFARGCFDGVFKSTDGGITWRSATPELANEGGQEKVEQLVVSLTYTRDRTLWTRTSSHIYRSQDGGESWQQADRGLEGLELDKLVLSPDYEVDRTALVTAGRGVYITRNEGEGWEKMELPLEGLWVTELFLSSGFGTDGVLFVVGFDEQYLDRLFRSADGGATWLDVGERVPSESFTGFALSPRYSVDGLVFVVTETAVYRSTDGGETWQPLNLPGAWAPLFAFSPDFADDETIYTSLGGGFYRSRDGGGNWTPLHQAPRAPPTVAPSPTLAPPATPLPSPSPMVSPTPLVCPGLDPIFQLVADRVESLRREYTAVPNVGCPTPPAQNIGGACQMFLVEAPGATVSTPGYMIWRSDTRTIYVIPQGDSVTGLSEAMIYDDKWSEGMSEISPSCEGLTPPTGLQIPIRGFGKVWCENGLYERIGFGNGAEQGGNLLIQETDRGLYLGLPDGRNFIIDVVDGLALSQ